MRVSDNTSASSGLSAAYSDVIRNEIMDGYVALKICAASASAASFWLDFRPKKRKQHADPVIALADENERHQWRYARRGLLAVSVLAGVCLFWTVISGLIS